MKRTELMKITVAVGILLGCVTTHGAYAVDAPKSPAAVSEAGAAKKGEGAVAGATDAKQGAAAEAKETKKEAAEAKETDGGFYVPMKVPLGSSLFAKIPVAIVNDDKISFGEYSDVVMSVHQALTEEKEGASSGKSLELLLNRLINIRLFVQEARNIELDQLPEVKEALDNGYKKILREVLYRRVAEKAKPDAKEVETAYKAAVKEVKLKPLEFAKEDDANNFVAALKSGKKFDELAAEVLKKGLAKKPQEEEKEYVKFSQLHPKIAQIISTMKPNAVTPVIQLSNNFLVFKLVDIRYPENPEAKEAARASVLEKAKLKALKDYKLVLFKKYLVQNTKLIKALDFESKKPGIAKLLTDKRVLVTVKGDKPITVADLTAAMKVKFFHGLEVAAEEKKINKEKTEQLDDMMSKIVYTKEAQAQHLDQTDDYREKADEFSRSLLFGAFIEKAVRPDVKATEEDLKAYYKEHLKQYTYPELVRLEGIAYKKSADAKSAIDKLRKGMDFKWLQLNAEGLVDKNAPELMNFDGGLVTATSMPEGVQKAIAGAKPGDYRLYESPEGYNYVLLIASIVPEKEQPYSDVREAIMKAVYNEKFTKVVDEWGEKLRKAATIKVYLDLAKKNTPAS